MARLSVALATLLAACLLATGGAGASAPRTALTITYWPHGQAAASTVWTLRCAPAGGTHPLARKGCAEVSLHLQDLLPPRTACTILPPRTAPVARVRGTALGHAVNRLVRPGCGTGWHDLAALVTGR